MLGSSNNCPICSSVFFMGSKKYLFTSYAKEDFMWHVLDFLMMNSLLRILVVIMTLLLKKDVKLTTSRSLYTSF